MNSLPIQLVHVAGEGRNVGKTLLGEMLVSQLASRGVRVCAVKHVHHGVDYRVKDTGRYLSAGAATVVAVGPTELMVVYRGGFSLEDALCLTAPGCDVVVVEGFREQQERLRRMGACTVYIGRGRITLESQCGGFSGEWSPSTGTAEEYAGRIAELVLRGCCAARLGELCAGRRLIPSKR